MNISEILCIHPNVSSSFKVKKKKKIVIQSPGEPREHRLGKVLQGRLKSIITIILSYLIVLFFGGFRFQ